jgi:S-adenosylmethionine:diacylglycerol 3-amino-3-carboxypropyl transferase
VIEFNGRVAELTRSGATAAMLLDAQKWLSTQCVEEVLKKVDRCVANDAMTPEKAVALVHEIAAYRRLVYRQQQIVDAGENAARGVSGNG